MHWKRNTKMAGMKKPPPSIARAGATVATGTQVFTEVTLIETAERKLISTDRYWFSTGPSSVGPMVQCRDGISENKLIAIRFHCPRLRTQCSNDIGDGGFIGRTLQPNFRSLCVPSCHRS